MVDDLLVINLVWKRKLFIVSFVFICVLASVFFTLALPNKYTSEVIASPANADGKGGLSGLASDVGGLAAIAGINLGGGSDGRIHHAIELMKSWTFLGHIIETYKLKPKIMAAYKWDSSLHKIVFDKEIYAVDEERWLVDSDGVSKEPSSWETYQAFSQMLRISFDNKNALIRISIEHISPTFAHELVNILVKEINAYFQAQDIIKSKKNIAFLNAKIEDTQITEMRSIFYGMIESQTRTLMLAEVSNEYLIETIVPAKIAEEKSAPARSIIVFLTLIFSTMLSVFFILIVELYGKRKNK